MVVNDPTTIRIDTETKTRLRAREQDDDASYDDIVTRLLDETETVISIKEVAHRLRDEFDDVALITVGRAGGRDLADDDGGMLLFTVHAPIQPGTGGWREELSDVDRVSIDGEKHWFDVMASADLSTSPSSVALFATDSIIGMEPLSVEDGVEQVRDAVADPDFSDPRLSLSDADPRI